MDNNNPVTVKLFNTLGQDERGITADFNLPRQQSDFIYITRKAGSISGHSYHEGTRSGTNPKLFLLLKGEINFQYRCVNEEEKKEIVIKSPAQIEVLPNVIHAMVAITDIIALKCNSIADIEKDRIKETV